MHLFKVKKSNKKIKKRIISMNYFINVAIININ